MAETSASGAAVQVNTYDEYGQPGAGNTSRFGYTGQMWIAEIGLYHYRNRVYNPRLGRFMQTDPIGQRGGLNLYAYVGNDPVNFTDPWGLYLEVIQVHGSRFGWAIGGSVLSGFDTGVYIPDHAGEADGKCGALEFRVGLSPTYSSFPSPENAVGMISRAAFAETERHGNEIGGFIVERNGAYYLSGLVMGTPESVDLGSRLRFAQREGGVVGAWHTHPNGSPNFSAGDDLFLDGLAGEVGGSPTLFAVGSSGRFGSLRYSRMGYVGLPGGNVRADHIHQPKCEG